MIVTMFILFSVYIKTNKRELLISLHVYWLVSKRVFFIFGNSQFFFYKRLILYVFAHYY